jgi:predicted amino acid dehydrogenase
VDTFAFIIHPIDPKRDVSRKYPILGKLFSESQIDSLCRYFPPVKLSTIRGIVSASTGKEIEGFLIACPLTAARMLELPHQITYKKIIQTGRLAEKIGADFLGLGAFTSVVGDGGLSIASALTIPVTTGNSFTVAVAVQAIKSAARLVDIDIREATAGILGATGSIGQVCARLLVDEVGKLILIGRDRLKLHNLQEELNATPRGQVKISTNLTDLEQAKLVISVSSALSSVIKPEYLQPGTIICDVARPRDVSAQVANTRQDVLVIDGGMVDVPGNVNFNFDFGFPTGKAYACMAETMALTLEGRFEDFTIGKEIQLEQVKEITRICEKHGFRLSGFRSFERPVTTTQIERVRRHAE